MKLTASVIWRPGETARYQPALIHHLLGYVDEARVLYDGYPGLEAQQIAAIPRTHVCSRGPSLWKAFGEGHARQRLLEWTLEGDPTHILAVDADEFVPNGRQLRRIVERNPTVDVFALRMCEVWERHAVPWTIRVDGGWVPHWQPILWRVQTARPDDIGSWEIPDRQLASGRVPEMVALLGEIGEALPTVDICHLGWSDPTERKARSDRYMAIDGGQFHDRRHLESILEVEPELEPYPAYPDVL